MEITRENYGAFFLDYYEGSLSEAQTRELMDFLKTHPDLKAEFEAFEAVSLETTLDKEAIFPDRESIKKPETLLHQEPSETDRLMIAHFEGDLRASQSAELLSKVAADPTLRKSFGLFAATRLEPDHGVVFDGKKSLKKYAIPVFSPLLRHVAVAAAILGFLAGLFFLLPSPDHNGGMILSQTEPTNTQTVAEEPVREPVKEENTTPVKEETPSTQTPAPVQRPVSPPPARVVPQSLHSEFPAPVLVATINALPAMPLQPQAQPHNISPRDEFAWFSWIGRDLEDEGQEEHFATPGTAPYEPNYISLASLARSGIERTTGINFDRVEEEIRSDRLSFWDLAGAGLAGISQITGTSLTIDKERDEDGRITLLAIGDRFRIKR